MNDSKRLGVINIDDNHYEVTMYMDEEKGKMVRITLNDVTVLDQSLLSFIGAELERCLGKEKGTEHQTHQPNEPIRPKPFTPVNIDNKWLYSQEEVDAVFKEREQKRKLRKMRKLE